LQQLLQIATPTIGINRLGSLGKAVFFVAEPMKPE
jgi:hypothetical protein